MSMRALAVFLGDQFVGDLTLLPGHRTLFSFSEEYAQDATRPTLSQFYLSTSGDLILESKPTFQKIPNWFSNLLPEGRLRHYLAHLGGINPDQEFQLIELLGNDLPGAVRVFPRGKSGEVEPGGFSKTAPDLGAPLRFSLAGVQLKFSAIREKRGGMTIPAVGIGGDWIVKLPSEIYPQVPENEEAMLTLAAKVGIEVPEHFLMPVEEIKGLPDLGSFSGRKALVVRRFDRSENQRIHMEDLAQVFGIPPADKYEKIGVARIAQMIDIVIGKEAAQDFIARLVFVVLTGNGDMHLKNWSLLYPDKRTPILSPAYDLVSTIPYIPRDRLALNFMGEKSFQMISKDRFLQLARKADLSEKETASTVEKIAHLVQERWLEVRLKAELQSEIADKIEAHMNRMLLGFYGS
jgi:serine/threonine-protein kinase HipA